ncbi:MAG: LacI family transcriptional regulator [Treponema sp.]|jgi:DNA-binding LacI/PurR family transcriptional regulator|nr:LacI family transcriptional regulator [Treponema sp.]
MSISIKDIARLAGVTVGTVSRALNDYSDISEKTKKAILKIVAETGYTPNVSARTLSSKRQTNIALLLSGIAEEKNRDSNVLSLLVGAYKFMNDSDRLIATYPINSRLQQRKTIEQLCAEYSLSGVIIFGLKNTDLYYKNIQSSQIPCVVVDFEIQGARQGSVITNDEQAFADITEYVINQNHRRLILVYGRDASEVTHRRYTGFCAALKKNNLDPATVPVIYTDFQEQVAYDETCSLLREKGRDAGTVFVCMSDYCAFGVLRAIHDCGFSVPEDFSVTGFDGTEFSRFISPQLTTIDQNFVKKGFVAAQLLCTILEKETVPQRIRTVDYTFRKGESVRYLAI